MVMCIQNARILLAIWFSELVQQPYHEQVYIKIPDAVGNHIQVVDKVEPFGFLVPLAISDFNNGILQAEPHDDSHCAHNHLNDCVENVDVD